jgi:methionyl-tRNA synthetase
MKSYLTTPIYYVNGPPHLGHAFTSVVGDILKRNRNRLGISVKLSTGCDEHGQKNQQAAAAAGLAPQDYLNRRSAEFKALFGRLGVSSDVFVRTSDSNHVSKVQRAVAILDERGLLRTQTYVGRYCAGCEQFKRPSDLDARGFCLEHPNIEAALISEENYFLRIEPFREQIAAHIARHPDFVRPQTFQAQLLKLLNEPLEDLCISRPAGRVSLGVGFPSDARYVVYVWFDALMNYLTSLGWPEDGYEAWWSEAEHIIGKDILKTHGVYWPAMLLALGEALPRRLLVHSHWVGEGGLKMSKSLGNVVDPNAVIGEFGADALRYFFARHMRVDADSQISVAAIGQTYTAELSNKIGNLHARVLKFAASRMGGRIPPRASLTEADTALRSHVLSAAEGWATPLSLEDIPVRTAAVLDAAERLNQYVTEQAPWTLVKESRSLVRCETVIYVALDCLRLVFEALWPVMPQAAGNALASLGAPVPVSGPHIWVPGLDRLEEGHPLGDVQTLFPRIGARQ